MIALNDFASGRAILIDEAKVNLATFLNPVPLATSSGVVGCTFELTTTPGVLVRVRGLLEDVRAIVLAALATAAAALIASVGPWESVLYVDPKRGSDATGQRGNENRPFATPQAALNAMLTNDTVQLAPGLFSTTAALTVPATVVFGQCAGYRTPPQLSSAGAPAWTIISSAAAKAWELGANLGLARWHMVDLVHSGNKIISADGSVAPYAKDAFLVSGLYLTNCVGFVTAKYATQVVLQDHGVGNYVFTGCGVVQVLAMEGSGGNFTLTYDVADPLSTTANSGLQILAGSQCGAVTMFKQAHLSIDELSRVSTITGSGLDVNGASVPSVSCCGSLNNVDFATAGAELPDTATALTFDFRGSRFYYNDRTSVQPATLLKFKVGGAAGNFQTVKLDSTTTLPGCTITADAKIHITGRGSEWPAVVLTTPGADGDIIPPVLTGTIDTNGLAATAKTWVQLGYAGLIRTGAAPDTAFLTSVAQLCDAVITARATTGLSFTGNAVANLASWEAVWK